MKYGETLRQRSIPAWSPHNIDYDEIKYFIKERTTPGRGKSIAIPGHSDDKLFEFENALFHILEDQHTRIALFVTSKAGEIRRRLDHAKKQLRRLSAQNAATSSARIPIERLEKYSRLESDLLKVGDELRCLARFITTQRTAFRKLLKKYKKWTGSPELEARFRLEVLDSPKSFTNLDLSPLLDDYSDTLQNIRMLYETRIQQATSGDGNSRGSSKLESSIAKLLAATRERSKVELDTAISTVPFGETGSLASYFIHPDNIVELQVLLLRHLEYYTPRSRQSSIASPSLQRTDSGNEPPQVDCFMLVADDLDRFAREQSALTIEEREHQTGRRPQMAKVSIRWNNDDDAVVSVRAGTSRTKSLSIKKKYVDIFFDASTPLLVMKDVRFENSDQSPTALRDEVLKDGTNRPLFKIGSSRSRFIGLSNGSNGVALATLDSNVMMQKAAGLGFEENKSDFPFAVLQVRQEGKTGAELLSLLDNSHLVERVRGFSLQYHTLWQLYEPDNFAPPFWLPILSRDIRKLPPPMLRTSRSVAGASSGSQSATQRSSSIADTSTAVETAAQSSSPAVDQLKIPPLRSFRKKRRRGYVEEMFPAEPQQKYWSEYDHPEDGSQDGDAYVIYIDPNEKSSLEIFFAKIASFFAASRGQPPIDEETALVLPPHTPTTLLEDDEASSDEETMTGKLPSYGAITRHHASAAFRGAEHHASATEPARFLPRVTVACLAASMAILVVAYILATTSKHKYATEVNAGVLFAVACSLAFAVVGFVPMLTRRDGNGLGLGLAVTILVVDAVCSGGLLAWMLG